MFAIQFDAAGIYLVGTPTHQFHISFEELMSTTDGIIGLLEYGLPCKVLHAVLSRIRHRIWHGQAHYANNSSYGAGSSTSTSIDTRPPPLWIDNSGPALYEVRHGLESIRVTPQDLESTRFGRAIKEAWDGGLVGVRRGWIVRMVVEAFFIGIWRGVVRRVRVRVRKF